MRLEERTERIFQGVKTSADKIFILEFIKETNGIFEVLCKEDSEIYTLESRFLQPLIKGGDSRPFQILDSNLMLLFPYENGSLVEEKWFSKKPL
ncbi:MAG: adenine-specific DNA-methyltransferase [Arcticibacterium sp.]|jgi:adenine-specific DNA-methyltransferase